MKGSDAVKKKLAKVGKGNDKKVIEMKNKLVSWKKVFPGKILLNKYRPANPESGRIEPGK